MFSGIVETTTKILSVEPSQSTTKLELQRPPIFNDIEIGHSIAVNGVCLTVESFSADSMKFTLGAETIKITGWDHALVPGGIVNLERSLRLGDRIHGHLVSGHADDMGRVSEIINLGDSWILKIMVENINTKLVWKKGSLAINGVSLTVNDIQKKIIEFCIIPETLKRTNLSSLKVGDLVTIEYDYISKMYINQGAVNAFNI